MSEPNRPDALPAVIMALAMLLTLLFINAIIDTWAGYRDMHHIINLQRRVAELEQKK